MRQTDHSKNPSLTSVPPLNEGSVKESSAPAPPVNPPKRLLNNSPALIKFTVALIAFFHGLNEAAKLTSYFFQKDVLGFTAEMIQFVASLMVIPQIVKPFAGYFLDIYVRNGYSIQTWITVVELLKVVIHLWLAMGPVGAWSFVGLIVVRRIMLSFDSVFAEYVLGCMTREESRHKHDSKANEFPVFFIWKNIGGVVGVLMSGWLLEFADRRSPYLVSVAGPFVVILYLQMFMPDFTSNGGPLSQSQTSGDAASLSKPLAQDGGHPQLPPSPAPRDEPPPANTSSVSARSILGFFGQYDVVVIMGFTFLLNFNPDFSFVTQFYANEILAFNSADLATMFVLFYGMSAACIFAYSRNKASLSTKTFYALSIMVAIVLKVFCLLIFCGVLEAFGPGVVRAVSIVTFAGLLSLDEINFPPVLAHISKLCPTAIMATTMGVISCLVRAARHYSEYAGSVITGFLDITSDGFERAWLIPTIGIYYLTLLFLLLLMLPMSPVGTPQAAPAAAKDLKMVTSN